jgi:hypothetical protein
VVAVVFQIIFYVKIHVNNVFLFFKNYFWHQHIKLFFMLKIIWSRHASGRWRTCPLDDPIGSSM